MRYPLGVHDFRRLRTDGFAYVDKTRHIIEMLNAGVALFLSRPRRFGKSLTVSTLAELYGGESAQHLFKGLWAEAHWDFARMQRPVIWLRLGSLGLRNLGLESSLTRLVEQEAKRLGVALESGLSSDMALLNLISAASAAHSSGRCVVLIDEYDKPIVDYLHEQTKATAHRDGLKAFYGVLKDANDQIELLFLTGVSAFSKVSIFSDLNHLVNLTLHPAAEGVVGITAKELETHFATDLDATGLPRDVVRAWYNGYSWSGRNAERVYNPWSLLCFLSSQELSNYWYQTGTPYWLVRLMRDRGEFDLVPGPLQASDLLGFNIDHIDTTAALFQTGYLTIAKRTSDMPVTYLLDYPNLEVRQSLQFMMLASYLNATNDSAAAAPVGRIVDALRQNELTTVVAELNGLLAGVPYDLWSRGDEGIFHAIVHLTFALVGVQVRSEVHTARGRCDALVETPTHVYAFEFKRDRPLAEALAQIHERGYLAPYAASAKTCVAVGVVFDSAMRQIGAWDMEVQKA